MDLERFQIDYGPAEAVLSGLRLPTVGGRPWFLAPGQVTSSAAFQQDPLGSVPPFSKHTASCNRQIARQSPRLPEVIASSLPTARPPQ
jgi:hypothetical protein